MRTRMVWCSSSLLPQIQFPGELPVSTQVETFCLSTIFLYCLQHLPNVEMAWCTKIMWYRMSLLGALRLPWSTACRTRTLVEMKHGTQRCLWKLEAIWTRIQCEVGYSKGTDDMECYWLIRVSLLSLGRTSLTSKFSRYYDFWFIKLLVECGHQW